MNRHLALFHRHHLTYGAHGVNVNAVHAESLSRMDRTALFVTNRIGTFGTFLAIAGWTVLWLAWNLLAPPALRFDPGPAFVFWLFVSNLIQISLMPLLMVGQNLESKHAELRAEADYQVNQASYAQLQAIEAQLTEITKRLEKQQ